MSADFSKVMAHLEEGWREHADRDGLIGVRRTLFLMRGGRHFEGEVCPSQPPEPERKHMYWCEALDEECDCYWV